MAKQPNSDRWQTEAVNANARFLQERWTAVTRQWQEASATYRRIYNADAPDVSQLRSVSRYLYELEQQKAALRYALSA